MRLAERAVSGDGVGAMVPASGGARTWWRPSVVVAVFYGAMTAALLATHAWDPRFFATVGPQWQRHDPQLAKQADGMIFFDYAVDPVAAAARHERRRTIRILYPLAAHILGAGRADLVAWPLLWLNLGAIVLGTEVLHRLLQAHGLPAWAALAYGAWYGIGLALLHDTSEPFAYLWALVAIALLMHGRLVPGAVACLAALLTRETTILLVLPFLLAAAYRRGPRRWTAAIAVLAAWGAWYAVVAVVGRGDITPAAWTPRPPLAGYLSTRLIDLPVTVVCLVTPALVVFLWSARELTRRRADPALWAGALNALFVLWFPPKTTELLWHSGRLATGFVAATLLAAPLARSSAALWRAIAVVFAASAGWTAAVALRFLVWDVAPW
jgi:hypothetical protein